MTQLIGAIRRLRREAPGAAEVIGEHCGAHDYDDPGKPAIAWDGQQARAALVDAPVSDAHRLLGHLPEHQRTDPVPVPCIPQTGIREPARFRLVRHAEVIAPKGDSYRLKDRDLGRVPTAGTTEE